jgi:hypothetical protein
METLDPMSCPELAPDYSRSLLDVYRDVARHILMHEENTKNPKISVLSAVQHLPDDPIDDGFPSWVPRWDQQNRTMILSVSISADT